MRLAKVESLLADQTVTMHRMADALDVASMPDLPNRRHHWDAIETCQVRWQTIMAGDIVWWTDTGILDPQGPGEWRQVVRAEPSARYIGDVVISIYEAESETEVACQFPQIDLATVQNPIGPRG